MGVIGACTPRSEVLKGDLEDAIFAADFGDVVDGRAPDVYQDPVTFSANTHPAQPLRQVVQAVLGRLADPKEAGASIRLSTGFGGGKIHTLIALWYLARNVEDIAVCPQLLPAAGRPSRITVVGIDAHHAGVPEFSRHGGIRIHSLWGELFYQLAGRKALADLGAADDAEASPNQAQIEEVLPEGVVLILLDELVDYMARICERAQGNLLGFVRSLADLMGKRPQRVLVVTDPAGHPTHARQAADLEAVAAAAGKADEVISRVASDFDPIGGEITSR